MAEIITHSGKEFKQALGILLSSRDGLFGDKLTFKKGYKIYVGVRWIQAVDVR